MNPALFTLPTVQAFDVVPADGNLGSLLDLAACGSWARHIANGRTVTVAQHNAMVASFAFAADVLASPSVIAAPSDLFDIDPAGGTSGKPSVLLGRRGLSWERGDVQWPEATTRDEGIIDLTTFTEGERREAWAAARACLRLLAWRGVEFVSTEGASPLKVPAGWMPYSGPGVVLVGNLATGAYVNLPRKGLTEAQCAALATVRIRESIESGEALAVAVHHGRIADTAAWFANARTSQRFAPRSARMTRMMRDNPLTGTRAVQAAQALRSATEENGDGGTRWSGFPAMGGLLGILSDTAIQGVFRKVTHSF